MNEHRRNRRQLKEHIVSRWPITDEMRGKLAERLRRIAAGRGREAARARRSLAEMDQLAEAREATRVVKNQRHKKD